MIDHLGSCRLLRLCPPASTGMADLANKRRGVVTSFQLKDYNSAVVSAHLAERRAWYGGRGASSVSNPVGTGCQLVPTLAENPFNETAPRERIPHCLPRARAGYCSGRPLLSLPSEPQPRCGPAGSIAIAPDFSPAERAQPSGSARKGQKPAVAGIPEPP